MQSRSPSKAIATSSITEFFKKNKNHENVIKNIFDKNTSTLIIENIENLNLTEL